MVLYLILTSLDLVVSFVINLIPVFETPDFIANNFTAIMQKIWGFNLYLPIAEVFIVILFLIGFTFQYKVLKVVLNKAGIDLNA